MVRNMVILSIVQYSLTKNLSLFLLKILLRMSVPEMKE